MAFERTFHVSWAQLDSNGHMANTAYLDVVVDVRFMYFASCAFTPAQFHRRHIGPVVQRDEVDYFKELRLLEPFRVNMLLAGLSPDASRFRLRNEIRREDGELAAHHQRRRHVRPGGAQAGRAAGRARRRPARPGAQRRLPGARVEREEVS